MTLNDQTIQTVQRLVSQGKQTHPRLASRLERALVILLFRDREYLGGGQWAIPSEQGDRHYTTSVDGCTCPDAASGRPPLGLCKHRLAIRLLARADQEIEAQQDRDMADLLASAQRSVMAAD